jgi:tRNA (guanine-N7-)-methyltransferase
VQDESLDRIARILAPGGQFRFASDIPDYVAWTLERVLRNRHFTWTAEKADDWRRPWPGFCRTRYEAKALREGRTPCYLVSMRAIPGKVRSGFPSGIAQERDRAFP